MANKVFITGTDTGVGKTVFTAYLLWSMRRHGLKAFAMKPLCSGGREDALVLNRFQDEELPLDQMNPFHYPLPASPLVAARSQGGRVLLKSVTHAIEEVDRLCDWLLIEGAGGLLSPLGEGFTFLDVILRWKETVCVVAKNRLGVMNHVLLTEEVLKKRGVLESGYVLVDPILKGKKDPVKASNLNLLGELLGGNRVFSMGNMGKNPCKSDVFKKHESFFEKTVAPFLRVGRLSSVGRRKSVTRKTLAANESRSV